MHYYVYKIINLVNNKPYIGKTTKTIEKRWSEHAYEASRWQKCFESGTAFGYSSRLYPAMNKYGYENFNIQLIEELFSLEEMNQREKYWISFYDARHNGYNISAGGDGGFFAGCKHSPEAIEKIRMTSLNRRHSLESRIKISKSKIGHFTSKETREKIRKAKIGSKVGPHSLEWNKNISEGHRNEIICVNTGEVYNNIKAAASKTGISRSAISNCVGGFTKTAGGFSWQYLNKNK